MSLAEFTPDYGYRSAEPSDAHRVLWPELIKILLAICPPPRRLLDFGCGNGSTAGMLSTLGYDVVGIDISQSGIAQARRAYSMVRFEVASVYDDLYATLGAFDVVVSLEVIEHLYAPRVFTRRFRDLICPGGIGVISTPFHGYWKNLVIALAGRFDGHFSPLWDGGHIKFWSVPSIRALLSEVGFEGTRFRRAGRLPPIAKSMIAIVSRPAEPQKGGA